MFYAMTVATYFVPRSAMRDRQERIKNEATPRLARGASASFLIPASSTINSGGKPHGMNDVHLSYHDFIRPHEIYDLVHPNGI